MNLSESILYYKLYLKRKNYSVHTLKSYLHMLQRFLTWLAAPVEVATPNVKFHRMVLILIEKYNYSRHPQKRNTAHLCS